MKKNNAGLTGMRFGKLVVLGESENNTKGSRKKWICKCDCGNTKEVRADTLKAKNKPTRSCGCIKKNYNDLTGRHFGRLTVTADNGDRDKNGKVKWTCVCDCGNTTLATGGNLINGGIVGCGCLSSKNNNLIGKRFGKLTVLSRCGNKGRRKAWACECDCGNKTTVSTNHLTQGNVTSCGCSSAQGVNLIGRKVNMLTVIKDTGKRMSGSRIYQCECECGNVVELESNKLRATVTKSCGCARINPDLTDEERMRKHRYSIADNKHMYKIRKLTFERDDYTCQICKARNGSGKKVVLNAHHIDGWNWCKEKRFDVDNMTTLCGDCHRDFHKQYGNGDNTKEQFEEYRKKVLV